MEAKKLKENKGIRIIEERAKCLILKGIAYKPKQDVRIEDMYLPQLGYNTDLEPLEGLELEIEGRLGECCHGEIYEIGVEGELQKQFDRIVKVKDKDEAFIVGNELF